MAIFGIDSLDFWGVAAFFTMFLRFGLLCLHMPVGGEVNEEIDEAQLRVMRSLVGSRAFSKSIGLVESP